jgi:hypothetical protein
MHSFRSLLYELIPSAQGHRIGLSGYVALAQVGERRIAKRGYEPVLAIIRDNKLGVLTALLKAASDFLPNPAA